MSIIEIDGSYGEGGGQLLRYAALYAAVTLKPVKIFNIRIKRPNPGLRPQHLTVLKIMREIFDGEVRGLYVGSKEVIIKFSKISSALGNYNIGTAGSISLILQSIIPPLLLADKSSEFVIKGGTDVRWSPPIDYMKEVYRHLIKKFGGYIDISVIRRGFYPRGGGIVRVRIEPGSLKGWIKETRENLDRILVYNNVYRLSRNVLNRQRSRVISLLRKNSFKSFQVIDEFSSNSLDPGTSLVIIGFHDKMSIASGGDSLGERGKPAEKVAEEAFNKFIEWFKSNATLDIHIGDMCIPLAVLARGRTVFSVPNLTKHIESALYVTRKLYDSKIEIIKRNSYILLRFK